MKNISELLKNEKSVKLILFAGIAVIAAIFLFDMLSPKKSASAEKQSAQTDFSQYESELEQKLAEILANIEGTGEINVMITVENTEETILSEKETTVTKTIMPKIRGVIIICGGAENVIVRQKITEAVTRVFDISSTKVAVVS